MKATLSDVSVIIDSCHFFVNSEKSDNHLIRYETVPRTKKNKIKSSTQVNLE